jgi:RNA polymerase sigma factor (sigma-70 family)
MSPASLRRYRAERLLREEFRSLRASVIAGVRRRLRACGAELDEGDLEDCYAQAWQGLYAATLEGERIASPAGWLATVSFRRAVDEQRRRNRVGLSSAAHEHRGGLLAAAPEPDVAGELDQRARLRNLFEGLRLQLGERERQAATLCYLQGLSRAQAASTMGVSEKRMRKLMEGTGPARPGVARKVAALADTIASGAWCEEQGSLMRGLAYGLLDPGGERHQLALLHTSGCPACRAYVASLRGLAAILPPAPSLFGMLLAGGAGAARAAGAAGASAGAAPASVALSSGAVASGSAGAAGGGWLLAGGGLSAKLAAGCLLALGVGAGCAALEGGRGAARAPVHARHGARPQRAGLGPRAAGAAQAQGAGAYGSPGAQAALTTGAEGSAGASAAATPASREFGLERAGASPGAPGASAGAPSSAGRVALAKAASAPREFAPAASSPAVRAPAATLASSAGSPAQREFSPG